MTASGVTLDGRYRLEERIATGGVGQVWRGRDLLLQRPVAVKLLLPEFAEHPETLERFRAEARQAGALPHLGIVQVYDYCDGGPDTTPYLVLELIEGPSLAGVLRAGPIPAARALNIIAQVATGLAAAHRMGLMHRDIKPANILFSKDGHAKIADFGVAHTAGSARLTEPGMVMGTVHYLAPERITGEDDCPASDLYSLGIVLYECLAGQPPFDGTTAEVMRAHLSRPLPVLPSGTPGPVLELLIRLTAKDPALRLGDAEELASTAARLSADLEAGVAAPPDEPLAMAEPVSAAAFVEPALPRARSTRGRRRPILAMAAALVFIAALSSMMATGALRLSTHLGQAAPGPAPRSLAPSRTPAVAPSQKVDPSTKPPPQPSPSRSAGPGRNSKRGQAASVDQASHSTPQTGHTSASTPAPGPASTPAPRPAGTPNSTGSGVGVQIRVPGTGIGVSLHL